METVTRRRPRQGFALVEVLVVAGIIALLLALMLPTLGAARESARSAICVANLRQAFIACRTYADENRGYGPAIGEPYAALPNWGLVVQRHAGEDGRGPNELFKHRSVLVCPSAVQRYAALMTRTYAMNATGYAGAAGDVGNFDDPARPAHIRFDRLGGTVQLPILLDSARAAPATGGAPPALRTASTIDFRDPSHVERRVGWHHARGRSINFAASDGSAGNTGMIAGTWQTPLP